MSKKFFDSNKDADSQAEIARRRSFIARMERKLELKESIQDPRYS